MKTMRSRSIPAARTLAGALLVFLAAARAAGSAEPPGPTTAAPATDAVSWPDAPEGWTRTTSADALPELLRAAEEAGGLALLLVTHARDPLPEGLEGAGQGGGFVRAVIDTSSDAGRALVEARNLAAFPLLLALTPDGREAARLFPVPAAADWPETLRAVEEGRLALDDLERHAAGSPYDLALAYEIGRQYALRGDAIGAKRHFARLFVFRRMVDQSSRAVVRGAADVGRLGDAEDFGPVRAAVEADLAPVLEHVDTLMASAYFALGEHVYVRARRDWANGLRILEELRRRFPDSPEARAAGLSIALAHHHLGSARRARTELARHLDEYAREPGPLSAAFRACADEEVLLDWTRGRAEEAVETHAEHPALWSALAALRERTGDAEGALEAARRAESHLASHRWYAAEVARIEGLIEAAAETDADPDASDTPDEDTAREASATSVSASDG